MDRTRPLKFESIATGGSSNDYEPTEVNPKQDAIDCFGLSLQNSTSDDTAVNITRNGNEMLLTDSQTNAKLAQLLKIAAHAGLSDIIHFLPEGPGDGNAYKTTAPTGAFLPTTVTWWASSAMTTKIIEKTITYSGILPVTLTWKLYNGATLVSTVTDTIAYSGIVEVNRTRTYA